MIRLDRKHYSDRAFSRVRTFRRVGGKLGLRVAFERRSPLGDTYELRVWPAALRGKARAQAEARCELIEDRSGKWTLATGVHCQGSRTQPRMPAAVMREVDLFVAELDQASRDQHAAPPKPPKKKRARKRKGIEALSYGDVVARWRRLRVRQDRAWERWEKGPSRTKSRHELRQEAEALDRQVHELEARMHELEQERERVEQLSHEQKRARALAADRALREQARLAYERGELYPTGERKPKRAVIEERGGQLAMWGQTEMFP